jgi:hypothetical protein
MPRRLIEHSLNVDPKATPKQQHLRCFADDRWDAIKKELAKLLATGFIREVFHPEWLANLVLVRKKNTNEWRMCVDYTDQNKHYTKDSSSTSGKAATRCADWWICAVGRVVALTRASLAPCAHPPWAGQVNRRWRPGAVVVRVWMGGGCSRARLDAGGRGWGPARWGGGGGDGGGVVEVAVDGRI